MQRLTLNCLFFAGLAIALLLQWWLGNVPTGLFAFPLGAALLVAMCVGLWVVERETDACSWVSSLRSVGMSLRLLTAIILWCVVGGCLPQGETTGVPGVEVDVWQRLGFRDFPSSWPFVCLLVALLAHLSLVIFHRLRVSSVRQQVPFLLLHGGLWLAVAAGTVGSCDLRESRMAVLRSRPGRMAYLSSGRPMPLSYTLQMQDFRIERSETDGTPVQYAATLLLDGRPIHLSVNHPYAVTWCEDLYLMSFDTAATAANPAYCVVQIVRQPWKWMLYAGLLLLLAGAGWSVMKLEPTYTTARI